jgi:hypothetical protein
MLARFRMAHDPHRLGSKPLLSVGLALPNILESNIRAYQQAGPRFRQRLFCASDAPYGKISWNFGGFRALFQALKLDPESTTGYLGQNFAQFILHGYHRLLAQHT